ncbi:prolipoprotein diacylglyceryl transferase [Adhaeribacter arboris]|uniref:Phosphatidylglycerol--prolipoprotein diacylglyceryl transferase n=1 Tax=Adhaeribacter arboris TaxID=2072846 RepID=A0A2T2YJ32_9BACT|nr:prolipoprotein diacylglyceryl transferase [Adhaeribacter arboris]PSR55517.1 prolipoprotein diacylglyceryl transferase [Adhaeribacter arboris]
MAYIHWVPDGILVDFGFYALRWYSVLFASGFLFSYILLRKKFRAEGVAGVMLEKLTIYVVIATVIGARLGHCLFYDFAYYSQHPLEIFLPVRFQPELAFTGFQGLASHGGVMAILIAVSLYSYRYQVALFWILDKLALVSPLAGCLIRVGNLFNSEIIGRPTSVPWAFVFERVDLIPRHPGQLYEAISYLLIFILLHTLEPKLNRKPGFIFGLFLVLLFLARFLLEFFKADQSVFEAGMLLNMGQLLSIPFILLGFILLVLKNQKQSIIVKEPPAA